MPAVLTPIEPVNLPRWVADNSDALESLLLDRGGILFRGFGVTSVEQFNEFAQAATRQLLEYTERSSPRSKVRGKVYTSTEHPADQQIVLHNEHSYTLDWPMKICFYCRRPATKGGNTPIADARRVLGRLKPDLVARFERKQWMFVRNFGHGLALNWQEVFQTAIPSEVEEYCRDHRIEFEWKGEGRLRTRQVRPAVRRHPKTGERIWFNHAFFFNVRSLEPSICDSLLELFEPEDLAFNTFYGDGSPIEPEVIDELREAYEANKRTFSWEGGDILLLDNMLTAHGREPFEGKREVFVAMGDPITSRDETVR